MPRSDFLASQLVCEGQVERADDVADGQEPLATSREVRRCRTSSTVDIDDEIETGLLEYKHEYYESKRP